jgi:hypothetical protein
VESGDRAGYGFAGALIAGSPGAAAGGGAAFLAQVGEQAAAGQQPDQGFGTGGGGAAQGQVEAAVLEAQGGDAVGGVGAEGFGGLGQQGQGVVVAEQAVAGPFGLSCWRIWAAGATTGLLGKALR